MALPLRRQRELAEKEMDREQEIVNQVVGLTDETDLDALLKAPIVCVLCWKEFPAHEVRTTPHGTSICQKCAKTPVGRGECKPFDPLGKPKPRKR